VIKSHKTLVIMFPIHAFSALYFSASNSVRIFKIG